MVMDIVYNMKRELLRRGRSSKTVSTYLFYVEKFLLFCRDKDPSRFSKADVRNFLYHLMDHGLSGSSLNVAHNALRFMMIEVLHKGFYLKIKFSKKPLRAADYLTREEVIKLINVIEHPKHKLLVSLMYGSGLRVSEVVKLTKNDFDFSNMIGWVRHGKGGKDRPFIVPEKLKPELQARCNGPDYLMFPGSKGHLSCRSVQEIVRRAAAVARIDKRVHPHTLRHSFTTHLLESKTDLVTVQSLLGHTTADTTLVYAHVARPKLINVRSPLDDTS